MVFPQILGSILYTAGNSCYGRVESGGCWPLFPLQALALSGVGQAVDLGPAFQKDVLPSGVYFVIEKKVTYIFLKRPKMAFRGKILKI